MPKGGKVPRGYFRRRVWPRRKKLVFHRNVRWSLVLGVAFTLVDLFYGQNLGLENLKLSTVITPLIAFAGLSFSGCITGATVAIALPNDRLLATMSLNGSRIKGPKPKTVKIAPDPAGRLKPDIPLNPTEFSKEFTSHYEELVFTFTYSAVVQIALVIISVLILTINGDANLHTGSTSNLIACLPILILTIFFVYSILQLLSSIDALIGVGNLRDKYIRAEYISS